MNRKYTACLYAGVLFAAVICVTVISHVLEKSRAAEMGMEIETEAKAAAAMTAVGAETSLHFNVAGQEISLWPKNGQYYAFLPSACREAGQIGRAHV